MLTRAGWTVVAGAAAALAVGRLLGAEELFVLGAVAIALVVAGSAWVHRPLAVPALHRELHPARPMAGTPARVEIVARHRGTRRTAAGVVIDQVAGTIGARLLLGSIAPDDTRRVGYRLPTARRGTLAIGPLEFEITDPFGLARRRWRRQGLQHVTILPAIEVLTGSPVGPDGDEQTTAASAHVGPTRAITDLATLRPYVVGDDLRRVHWPTSARVDDLVVRRDEERRQGQICVLVHTGPWASLTAFEHAVSAAATLIHAAAEAGDRIRLQTTSGIDSSWRDARHDEAMLLETLAHLELEPSATFAPDPAIDAPRHSALVILTEAQTAAERLSIRSAAEAIVLVGFGTPPEPERRPATATTAAAITVEVPAGTSFATAWRTAGLVDITR